MTQDQQSRDEALIRHTLEMAGLLGKTLKKSTCFLTVMAHKKTAPKIEAAELNR
jgi:hypothetical protein